MKSSLIILEAKNNKFSSDDRKLINFTSNISEENSISVVKCSYIMVKNLKEKINNIYLLATKVSINIFRNSCTYSFCLL